jgi:large subunit ribosomal protein L32
MLPCQRKSKSQSRKRRSHMHRQFAPTHSVHCPNCGSAKLPHAACSECGYVRPGLSLKLTQEA